MTLLSNDITIDAPAERVWEIVAHRFDRIGEWATVIPSSVAVTEPRVTGRVCHTGIRSVPQVTETIVALDEATRTLTYEATAGMPTFVTMARNTWQVNALGDHQSRASYSGRFEVRGLLGWLGRRILLARIARDGQHLLDDLKHLAEHREPSPRKQGNPVAAVGVRPSTHSLRMALRANAIFSAVTGLALAVGGWFLAGLGPSFAPPAVGVVAILGGLVAARLAVTHTGSLRRWTIPVIIGDLLWVAGSAILLVAQPVPFTSGIVVAVVAVCVAVLAGWQLAGVAATSTSDPLADFEIVESSRVLPLAPHQVWPLLTDHQLYGRLAPNLSAVEVVSAPSEVLRRRCTSTTGQHWEETCTLWQEGRRFAVEVDTTAYPYPLRLVRGLWQVASHPDGCLVTIRFAYQAEQSVRGGLFVILLRMSTPSTLRRIFDGWQAASKQRAGRGGKAPSGART